MQSEGAEANMARAFCGLGSFALHWPQNAMAMFASASVSSNCFS